MKMNRFLSVSLGLFLALSMSKCNRASDTTSKLKESTQSITGSATNVLQSQAMTELKNTSPAIIEKVQRALKDHGFDVGAVNGMVDEKTISALKAFQASRGLSETTSLDSTMSALGISAPTTTAAAPTAPSAPANETSAMPANLTPSQVRMVQTSLVKKGASIEVDGILGSRTQKAIREFQTSNHLPETGTTDRQTLSALGVDVTRALAE